MLLLTFPVFDLQKSKSRLLQNSLQRGHSSFLAENLYHLSERVGIPGRIFSYTAAHGGREARALDYNTCGKCDGTSEHRQRLITLHKIST